MTVASVPDSDDPRDDLTVATRATQRWQCALFHVPEAVYQHWRGLVGERTATRSVWRRTRPLARGMADG